MLGYCLLDPKERTSVKFDYEIAAILSGGGGGAELMHEK